MLLGTILAQSIRAVEAPGHEFPKWLYWVNSIVGLLCMFLLLYGAYRLFDYVFRDIARRVRSLKKKKDTSGLACLALLALPCLPCLVLLSACTPQTEIDEKSVKTAQVAALQKDFSLTRSSLPPEKVLTFNTVAAARAFLTMLQNNDTQNPAFEKLYEDALPAHARQEATQQRSARLGFPGGGSPLLPPPGNPLQRQKGISVISLNVSLSAGIRFTIPFDRGTIGDVKVGAFGFTPGVIMSLNSFKQTRYYPSTNTYVVEVVCDQGIGLAVKDTEIVNIYSYQVKYTIFFSPDKPNTTIYTNMLATNNPSIPKGGVGGGGGGTIGGSGGGGGGPIYYFVVVPPPPSETAGPQTDQDKPAGAQTSYGRLVNR